MVFQTISFFSGFSEEDMVAAQSRTPTSSSPAQLQLVPASSVWLTFWLSSLDLHLATLVREVTESRRGRGG